MGATISVNGVELGNATNQFLRYAFALPVATLRPKGAPNRLEVRFVRGMELDGRFMACSGGWDWAPRTDTWHGEAKSFSRGIWRGVYIAAAAPGAPMILHVVPLITYRGAPPLSRLTNGGAGHSGFFLRVRVLLSAAVPTAGTVRVEPSWPGGARVERRVSLPAGEKEVVVHLEAAAVRLWWPAGLGSQDMYRLDVAFVPASDGASVVATHRRVGFRHVALVTAKDRDPGASTAAGSGSHGMLFRVNGVVLWARGANLVPMEQLEGRLDDEAHRVLAKARMNMLRVWGGGTFAPDALYDACDEEGVLLLHDFMYAQHGHAPSATPTQAAEIAHQVRRLAAHPSIVAWNACNECKVTMGTPSAIYTSFVMALAAKEDPSRPLWPSSPSLGWRAGVQRADGTPDGVPLEARDCSEPARSRARKAGALIETHGPYLRSSGFPAVDGLGSHALPVATSLPLLVPDTLPPAGAAHPNRFVSELGAVGMPSFESLAAQLRPSHWALHGGQRVAACAKKRCVGANVMAQRNFPCDSLILSYFGEALGLRLGTEAPANANEHFFNATGREAFRQQLYLCALAQALWMKSAVEASRATKNELGLLTWQLNDLWPTGGWGSLEYGAPAVDGQVGGGRWKPLHYLFRRTLFADVLVSCGAGGRCVLRNDAAAPLNGTVRIAAVSLATGQRTRFLFDAALPAGPGARRLLPSHPELAAVDGRTHVLIARCMSAGGTLMGQNEILLAPPDALRLPAARVQATLSRDDAALVTVRANATALFVLLTTRAAGHFSDNLFLLTPGDGRTVRFVPFGALDAALLHASLRVEHLEQRLRVRSRRSTAFKS